MNTANTLMELKPLTLIAQLMPERFIYGPMMMLKSNISQNSNVMIMDKDAATHKASAQLISIHCMRTSLWRKIGISLNAYGLEQMKYWISNLKLIIQDK